MKKILRTILLILSISLLPAQPLFAESLTSPNRSTSTTNPSTTSTDTALYYESDVFDYYLSKNSDGSSKMHVKESITAVFPQANVNHGITVGISYLTQAGASRSVSSLKALNFTATRNGTAEPIAKTEERNGQYIFYLGNTTEYLHGEQTYELEYDFENVINAYDSNGRLVYGNDSNASSQELYWDTNGTDSTIAINNLVARVHLPSDIAKDLTSGTSCYVGKQGENGSYRCQISSDDETTYNSAAANSSSDYRAETIVNFTSTNLQPGENLTFNIRFENGTFIVPAPTKNYRLVILTVVIAAIAIFIILLFFLNFKKHGLPKRRYYKQLFVAPQYQAPKEYHIAEAEQLILKKTKSSYVATLLELAVNGKIAFIKGEPSKILKKPQWAIKINNLDDITDSQEDLLRIVNDGNRPKVGDTIAIENHNPSSTLVALSKSYSSDSISFLRNHHYFEPKASTTKLGGATVFLVLIGILVIANIPNILQLASNFLTIPGQINIGADFLPVVINLIFLATVIICVFISLINSKYKRHTKTGLDAANYLEGLRLYISMAEAERLKFLQSTKGADTSKDGIVKLYEKLLPYACLFGLEESWLNELGRYCKEANYHPSWYYGNDFITFYAIDSMTRSISRAIASSTNYVSSSTGSSSSSSSGSFGGGFSGGGGGGGGRGGW